MRTLLFVGVGGFIGSVFRYLIGLGFSRWPSLFPYGTLVVNVAGCFLIGIIYALADKGSLSNTDWKLFLTAGLCGGFTTFSAFSYEAVTLIKQGNYLNVGFYVTASVALGVLATFLGISIIRSTY